MSQSWRSKVWYVFDGGVTLWSVLPNVGFVYGKSDWLAHWCDPAAGARAFLASPATADPTAGCQLMQAAFPGTTVRHIVMPATFLFPLAPATSPVVGPGTICP